MTTIFKEKSYAANKQSTLISYESSFCQYYTIATITQRGNKIKASAKVYKNSDRMDSIPCSIAQEYETEIDSASWVKFQEAIFAVDFWGLKRYFIFDFVGLLFRAKPLQP